MSLDYNDAPINTGSLIPKGEIVPVMIKIQPGKSDMPGMPAGDDGLFTQTKNGDAYMLNVEYTVVAGKYSKRKIFGNLCAKGNGSEGHTKWENGSRGDIRGMIESARQVDPKDDSDAAAAKRRVDNYSALNGMVFVGRVGIEESDDPQYEDKNTIRPITIKDKEYSAPPKMEGTVSHVSSAANTSTQSEPKKANDWG